MIRGTLRDPRSPAEICRERGWTIGTQIVGDDGCGLTIIQILGVGEQFLHVKYIIRQGEPAHGRESLWGLGCRDWQEVADTAVKSNPNKEA
ncbi:hypothetical protein MKK88_05955 [Methylobacterium sp. E-005]|uniref:DUF7241 domain-containing protein n=1 Tax=Methylobacterium sp. E-005 TaxID=2836549 RepID=UPI001FBB7817|nr:hypothetical protein [Methylobacterium sp. E-005]MCJ2085539.1 hypothetical protein [Methylobacterium sp. E-005]